MDDVGGTCLSPVGLELFLAFSCWSLKPKASGWAALLVKDWERFFLELSSKNSITKAWWGSGLSALDSDWDSSAEQDMCSSEPGEAKRCGGESLNPCEETWDAIGGSDWRRSFPLIVGCPESL